MESYSLLEVNQYIKQVISLNFQESIWVKAEISQIKEVRGQYYLDLIQKDEQSNEVVAQMNANIWYRSMLFIRKKLGDLSDEILKEGVAIQTKVIINFHEKYGLKFSIEDIDASYTYGLLELERKKTIEKLKIEELLYGNKINTDLPVVVQSIAIISSATAAGLQDFEKQLKNNPFSYGFNTTLFQASVQGKNLEKEIIQQLNNIKKHIDSYDCVVVVRGGGSKLDLSGFDSYELTRSIATFPIPVLTGIGHDIDQNVIELVAFDALKTPTAVANYLIDHNSKFENGVLELYEKIIAYTNDHITSRILLLRQIQEKISIYPGQLLNLARKDIENQKMQLATTLGYYIKQRKNDCNEIGKQLKMLDPNNILKKGYSLSYVEGKLLKSVDQVKEKDELKVVLHDGSIDTIVRSKN